MTVQRIYRKNDEFTCNLALIENNISTLGFVSAPVKGLIYYGGSNLVPNLLIRINQSQQFLIRKMMESAEVVASKSHLNREPKNLLIIFKAR